MFFHSGVHIMNIYGVNHACPGHSYPVTRKWRTHHLYVLQMTTAFMLLVMWCKTVVLHTPPPQPQPFYGPFPGPPRWAGARRKLLNFMVQGKINRGRHTDHLAGRHSVQTNQCPPPSFPHFLCCVLLLLIGTSTPFIWEHLIDHLVVYGLSVSLCAVSFHKHCIWGTCLWKHCSPR